LPINLAHNMSARGTPLRLRAWPRPCFPALPLRKNERGGWEGCAGEYIGGLTPWSASPLPLASYLLLPSPFTPCGGRRRPWAHAARRLSPARWGNQNQSTPLTLVLVLPPLCALQVPMDTTDEYADTTVALMLDLLRRTHAMVRPGVELSSSADDHERQLWWSITRATWHILLAAS